MSERSFTVRLSARVDAYVNAIKRAERETYNFSRTSQRNMGRLGSQMQSLGRMTTVAVTVPLAAAGAAAVKAGIDWESAFTGVRKTVDGSTEQIARLEQQLRDLSANVPSSHTEIAAIAEAAGQLGIHVDNVAEFTEVMVKLGDTTNIVGQEGAINLARFMNVMQTAPSRVGELGATIVHLGNNTATTEAEILELGTRISGAGKIAGLTEADVFALAAAITSVGVKAEAGGTATSKMLLKMHDAVQMGGSDLETLAQVAGMTSDQFKQLFEEDAARAFAAFISGIGRVADSGQAVTPIFAELSLADERLMRAMRDTANAGDLLTDSLDWANEAAAEGTALNDEAAKRYETTAAKLKIFRNNVYDLGIDLAEILVPMLEATVAGVSRLVDGFAAIPRPVQAMILVVAGLAAALGPIIWISGTLVRNIQSLSGALAMMGGSLGPVALTLAGVGATLGLVAAAYMKVTHEAGEATRKMEAQKKAIDDLTARMAQAGDPMRVIADDLRAIAAENPALAAGMNELGWSFDRVAGFVGGTTAEFLQWSHTLIESAKSAGATDEQVAALEEALKALHPQAKVAAANAREITQVEGEQAEATALTTEEIELKAEAEAAAQQAEDDYKAKVDATIESLERQKQALEDTVEALQARSDAFRAAADTQFALRDAEERHRDAIVKLDEVLQDEEATLFDVSQAMDGTAETARDVAERMAELAAETATAEGRTLSAAEKLDIFNGSLIEQAAALQGPGRDAILGYIGDVNGIPDFAVTVIETLIEQGKIAEAEEVLANTSRTRSTSIEAQVTEESLSRVERDIAAATRARTVGVTLRVNNPGALNGVIGQDNKQQLLDSGGQGYAGDIVAEQGPELVDGVLVTRPTMLTRPAKVTGRLDTERLLEADVTWSTTPYGQQPGRGVFDGLDGRFMRSIPYSNTSSTTTPDPVVVEVEAPRQMTLNVDGRMMTAYVEDVVTERQRREVGRK